MSFFTKHGNIKFVGDWKVGDTEYSLLQTVKPILDAGVFSIKTAPEGEAITGGVTFQAGTGISLAIDVESKTITLNAEGGLSSISTGIGLEGTGKEDSPLKVNLSAYHVGNQVISLRSNTGISLQGRTNEAEGPRLSLENDWEFSGGTTPTFKSVDRFTIELMSGGSDKEWPTLRAQGFSSGSYRNYLLLEEDGSIPSDLIPKMSLNTSVGITGNGTTENPLKINLNNLSLNEIVSITAPSFNFNSETSILFSIGNGQTFGLTAGDVTNDNQLETVFHVRDEGISLLAHGLSHLKLEVPTLDKLLLCSNLGTDCAANTAGGLVVVGGDGKIPASILPESSSTEIDWANVKAPGNIWLESNDTGAVTLINGFKKNKIEVKQESIDITAEDGPIYLSASQEIFIGDLSGKLNCTFSSMQISLNADELVLGAVGAVSFNTNFVRLNDHYQNTAGGFAVVENNGKLPESILPNFVITDGTTEVNAKKIILGEGLEVVKGETEGTVTIQRKRRTAIEFTVDNLTENKLLVSGCMVGDFVVVDADGVMVIPVIQQTGNDVQIDFTNWTVTGTWKVIFR